MKDRKLKVLYGLVNYGTQSGVLAKELRNQGVDALSVTYYDQFNRETDIQLSLKGSFFTKIFLRVKFLFFKLKLFVNYNTFHFFFGTSLLPYNIDLYLYRIFRKKVVFEYLGWDVQLYKNSIEKYEFTNAKTYKNNSVIELIKEDSVKLRKLKLQSKISDLQLVCAPYLSEFVEKSKVLPLAIDLSKYKYVNRDFTEYEIRILHAPTSKGNKGSDIVIKTIELLKNKGYNINFKLIQNVSHSQLIDLYSSSHIFIDQILAGWYGTASIEAMATGCPTICFIRESYYKYIDYSEKIPIINANPNNFLDVLEYYIINNNELFDISLKSRKYCDYIHD